MKDVLRIYPRRLHSSLGNSLWVFTDRDREIFDEPFVMGADTLLDALSRALGGADELCVEFSTKRFPGYSGAISRLFSEHGDEMRLDYGGALYYSNIIDGQLWLCPTLMEYYDSPPTTLFFAASKPSSAKA